MKEKKGNQVKIETKSGTILDRNVTHVKKYNEDFEDKIEMKNQESNDNKDRNRSEIKMPKRFEDFVMK